MLNVENRVKQLRLNHVYKIFNGCCPSYLSEHFTRVSSLHNYNTRGSSENFIIPNVSGAVSKTFYFNAIKDWNSLNSDIKKRNNFNSFKNGVKCYLKSQMQLVDEDIYSYY